MIKSMRILLQIQSKLVLLAMNFGIAQGPHHDYKYYEQIQFVF